MRETQKGKVLKIWITKQVKDLSRFFYPYEVIGEGSIFVGYKAPTRFCELCLEYPQMIETKMDGKYRIGRLRIESIREFIDSIPEEFKEAFKERLPKGSTTIVKSVIEIDETKGVARKVLKEFLWP